MGMKTADTPVQARPFWAGLLSFTLALAVTVLGFARVNDLAAAPAPLRLTLLALLLWAIAAGFTHGVGLVPRRPLLRILLGPVCGWPLSGAVLAALIILV